MAEASAGQAQLQSGTCDRCGKIALWKAGGPRPNTDHMCIPWHDQLASTRERRQQQRAWLDDQCRAGKILAP